MFDADSLYIRRHGPLKFLLHILTEQKRDILLLDENQTSSTTVALAAIRKTLHGLWSSSRATENLTAFRLGQEIINNRDFFVLHHQDFLGCSFQISGGCEAEEWWTVLDSELENLDPSQLRALDMKFTAAKIAEESTEGIPKQLVWLFFPWIEDRTQLSTYILDFIKSCGGKQSSGGIILLTLTEDDMWTDHYGDVTNLIKTAEDLGYSHWEDDRLVSGAFQHYGYQHRTATDARTIHRYVVPHSTTHIFIKT